MGPIAGLLEDIRLRPNFLLPETAAEFSYQRRVAHEERLKVIRTAEVRLRVLEQRARVADRESFDLARAKTVADNDAQRLLLERKMSGVEERRKAAATKARNYRDAVEKVLRYTWMMPYLPFGDVSAPELEETCKHWAMTGARRWEIEKILMQGTFICPAGGPTSDGQTVVVAYRDRFFRGTVYRKLAGAEERWSASWMTDSLSQMDNAELTAIDVYLSSQ